MQAEGTDASRAAQADGCLASARGGRLRRIAHAIRGSKGAVELSYFYIMWIFIITSILGLIVETLVSYPFDGYFKNRYGLIWGPFSPIYGCGAVLFTVTLNRLDKAPWYVTFLAAAVVGATFEFCAGWFWEHAFGIVAWSYIDRPFNLLGYTSLEMAFVWGCAGFLWMKAAPYVVHVIDFIPHSWRHVSTVLITIWLVLDVLTTIVGFSCWFERLEGNEPQGIVQEYFAQAYDDEFMEERFEVMSMWTVLADIRG